MRRYTTHVVRSHHPMYLVLAVLDVVGHCACECRCVL